MSCHTHHKGAGLPERYQRSAGISIQSELASSGLFSQENFWKMRSSEPFGFAALGARPRPNCHCYFGSTAIKTYLFDIMRLCNVKQARRGRDNPKLLLFRSHYDPKLAQLRRRAAGLHVPYVCACATPSPRGPRRSVVPEYRHPTHSAASG